MFTGKHVNFLAAFIEGKIKSDNSQKDPNDPDRDWIHVLSPKRAILKVSLKDITVAFYASVPPERLEPQQLLDLTEGGPLPVLFIHDVVQPSLLANGMTIISTGDQTVVMQPKTKDRAERMISRAEGENHWMLALCLAFISLT